MERIKRLTYRLKLPSIIKIYNIISITHLEPATNPALDPYRRPTTIPPTIVIDNHNKYKIKYLVRKRQRRYDRAKNTTIKYLAR